MTRSRSLAVACAGLALTAFAAHVLRHNFQTRYPFTRWGTTETISWSFAIGSCAVLAVAGPWLTWRLPTNHTGWWITGSGAALAGWILGRYSVQPASPWMETLLLPLAKASIIVAVVPWPTGRLHHRWAKFFVSTLTAYVFVGIATQFVGYRIGFAYLERGRTLPTIGDLVTGQLVQGLATALLSGLAPAILLAAVWRLRAGMPRGTRSTSWPAVVAAGVLGVSELWSFALGSVSVTGLGPAGSSGRSTLAGRIGFCLEVGRYGWVAMLLVLSEALRRRSRVTTAVNSVELGALEATTDESREVARILGDPSACFILRASAKSPTAQEMRGPAFVRMPDDRSRIEIADRSGVIVATVEHDRNIVASAVVRDALMASIGLTLIHRARQAEAHQRTLEVERVQREVLDAQDRARRRLERDLHDGVQQRLVALAIDASLLARQESANRVTESDRTLLRESIHEAVSFCHDVLREGPPGVLDPGLAAGLRALAALVPLTSQLHVHGDIAVSHPVAAPLWFVASEAVANCLKHADARTISIHLRVDGCAVDLTIADDGCGGVRMPPEAIVRRMSAFDSTIELTSPAGHGTAIRVRVRVALDDRASSE